MTDDQVIAKVRAAAMDVVDIYVPTRGDNIEIVCARAALAMVEQWEWHTTEETRHRELRLQHRDDGHSVWAGEEYAKQMIHGVAATRILAALRKAVGE